MAYQHTMVTPLLKGELGKINTKNWLQFHPLDNLSRNLEIIHQMEIRESIITFADKYFWCHWVVAVNREQLAPQMAREEETVQQSAGMSSASYLQYFSWHNTFHKLQQETNQQSAQPVSHIMLQRIYGSNVVCSFDILDKTHCQLYKRITGQIIPLSLLCADIVMVWSWNWFDHYGAINDLYLVFEAIFAWWRTNKHPTN